MAKNNGSRPSGDNQLTRLVKGSANQVWQAGRGAYSLAESEGSRLVGGLLSIGGRIEGGAKSRVFEVRNSATEAWDRLENAFVHRVARALNAWQIPTARDVQELTGRVEALQKAVVALERRAGEASAAPRATARKARSGRKAVPRGAKKAPAAARKKAGT